MDSSDSEEMSSDGNLEALFHEAADYVQKESQSSGVQVPDESLLSIYGLYKCATVGPCTEPKPGMFNMKGKAKWTAWMNVSNLTPEEAMKKYIDLVSSSFSWKPKCSSTQTRKPTSFGCSVSTLAKSVAYSESEPEFSIPAFNFVKDGRISELSEWLSKGNNVNIQDEENRTLLHWSVDRGDLETCKLLIHKGADLSIMDSENETALDYAITCDHKHILEFLNSQVKTLETT